MRVSNFMHTKSLFNLPLTVAALMLVAACTPMNGTYRVPDTQMVTESGETRTVSAVKPIGVGELKTFPDIPVPATHRIDLSESVTFSSPTQTMGKLVLVGNASVTELFQFFQDNMPAQGWSSVNAFESSVSSLYFAKPGRFVAIVITPDSKVYINVGPE